jgi:hypothetical protein
MWSGGNTGEGKGDSGGTASARGTGDRCKGDRAGGGKGGLAGATVRIIRATGNDGTGTGATEATGEAEAGMGRGGCWAGGIAGRGDDD